MYRVMYRYIPTIMYMRYKSYHYRTAAVSNRLTGCDPRTIRVTARLAYYRSHSPFDAVGHTIVSITRYGPSFVRTTTAES